jgi:hypothetical protein
MAAYSVYSPGREASDSAGSSAAKPTANRFDSALRFLDGVSLCVGSHFGNAADVEPVINDPCHIRRARCVWCS